MAVMTLSEAFSEIEIINRHLGLKREFLLALTVRPANLRDPLESAGGSTAVAAEEMRAIAALEEHRIAIRRAVRAAAASATITIGNQTRSIADWMEWRRKVAPGRRAFLASVRRTVQTGRREAQAWSLALPESDVSARLMDLIVNIPEADAAQQSELLEETLGSLDGQLSLKSATLTIELASVSKSLTEREALLAAWQKQIAPQPRQEAASSASFRADYEIPVEYDAYGSSKTPTVPYAIQQRVRLLLAEGRKIEAITLVREQTGWALSQSKQAVEALQ